MLCGVTLIAAESSVLLALWPPFSSEPAAASSAEIEAFAAEHFRVESPPILDLCARGWIAADGEAWRLTPEGLARADRARHVYRAEAFDDSLLESSRSLVYRAYNERVHGSRSMHHDMVDAPQLEALIEVANLTPGSRFLDLGCADGELTELLADRTGARGLGIDFAPGAIAAASARTADRASLAFQLGDLDELQLEPGAFDAVIAIDSLYFATDLAETLRRSLASLAPGGRLVAFWSLTRSPGEEDVDGGRLAATFTALGGDLGLRELTVEAHAFWERARVVLDDLREEFVAEGAEALWAARDAECTRTLLAHEEGRANRWLAWTPSS